MTRNCTSGLAVSGSTDGSGAAPSEAARTRAPRKVMAARNSSEEVGVPGLHGQGGGEAGARGALAAGVARLGRGPVHADEVVVLPDDAAELHHPCAVRPGEEPEPERARHDRGDTAL